MSNKMLYLLWAGLFVLCAGLGFVPQSEGFGTVVLVLLAVAFFLPGFTLLYRALPGKAGTFADGRIFIAVAIAALLQTFQTFNGFALLLPFVGGMLAGHYNIFNRLFYACTIGSCSFDCRARTRNPII